MTKYLTFENLKFNLITTLVLIFFLFPFLVFGQSSPNTGIAYECVSGTGANAVYGNCDFNDLVRATIRVINWIIIFALQFSVVVIAYAGFNYMISGDNPGKRSEANKMLRSVAIGIFFILAAWLIVSLIARTLLRPEIISVTPVVTAP